MALYKPQSDFETSLSNSISSSATSAILGVAPTETAGYLVIDEGTSNMEIVKFTGVSGTTITGLVRGLSKTGTDDATSVAANCKSHSAGASVKMTDVHYYLARMVEIWTGTAYSQGENFYIGNSANNDITFYGANGDTNLPFWRYDASENAWVVSDNGVDTYKISAGGSGVTAGDGIDITLGSVSFSYAFSGGLKFSAVGGDNKVMVDTGNSNIFLQTSVGSASAFKVPTLSASGNSAVLTPSVLPYQATPAEVDTACSGINNSATAANLNSLVLSGETGLHYHKFYRGSGSFTAANSAIPLTFSGVGFRPRLINMQGTCRGPSATYVPIVSMGNATHSGNQSSVYMCAGDANASSVGANASSILAFIKPDVGLSATLQIVDVNLTGFTCTSPYFSGLAEANFIYECLG